MPQSRPAPYTDLIKHLRPRPEARIVGLSGLPVAPGRPAGGRRPPHIGTPDVGGKVDAPRAPARAASGIVGPSSAAEKGRQTGL
jgi:hypothetical protein